MKAMKLVGAMCVLFGMVTCHAMGQAPVAFDNHYRAYEAWQATQDDALREKIFQWVLKQAETCPQSEIRNVFQSFRFIAKGMNRGDEFMRVCTMRDTEQDSIEMHQAIALQRSEWHSGIAEYKTAYDILEKCLKDARLTPVLRSAVAVKASQILSEHLKRPSDADALLVQTKTAISTNDAEAYATLCLARAALRESLHDTPGAIAELETILDYGEAGREWDWTYTPAMQRLALLLASEGRNEEAVVALLRMLGTLKSPPTGIAKRLIEVGAEATACEEVLAMLRRHILGASELGDMRQRIERIQPEVVDLLLALDRPAEAVAECRVFTLCAPDRTYPQAADLTARCLKALDRNLVRANAFLDFQRAVISPTNAVENVLLTFPTLSDTIRKEAYGKLAATDSSDWMALLIRSTMLCWMDRPVEAVEAARKAFMLCPMEESSLQACANAIARPILVLTRDPALAQRAVDHLLYGGDGPDGIRGTEDDIVDPLPEIFGKLSYK